MMRRPLALALVLAVFSILLAVLASGLRPDAFFVGDPGVKLIAARNALRFPAHPLNIPLPHIAGAAAPHVEPFFAVHGDHSHAITSELFPLLSAPFLTAFGLRGVYVLPAFGFIAALAACAWLARVLDARRDPALVAAVAGLGTPYLFYGLEFWEHMPAVALGVSGAALLLQAARQAHGQQPSMTTTFGAGLLLGSATVLRPEAACFAVAVAAASRTLVYRPTWRALAVAALGAVAALLPLALYSWLHFGTPVPGHVATNAALIGGNWLSDRAQLAADWLLPSLWSGDGPERYSGFWRVAPAAVLGPIALLRRPERNERFFLLTAAMVTVALVILVSPNAGGGQWGPRYLLFAYVPLTLLAADLAQGLPRRTWRTAVLTGAFVVCILVQRTAYGQLRGTKQTYGRITDFVAAQVEPGGNVVTDVWWLDQIGAAALEGRNVLVASDAGTGRNVVARLSRATVPSATVFRSRDQSGEVDSWSDETCYFEEAREELPVRGLVAIRLRHRCGYKP